ncbi:unnamed protein product [Ambrosiozyma monospora]|uniref:Unnamed protein product n=1 Tax=Ambrosiozyma monospora TaxID=43982 RepID=A0ACB5SR89_AMBMO|nr:unnamed protein product [Ambrosiozyma monospora]
MPPESVETKPGLISVKSSSTDYHYYDGLDDGAENRVKELASELTNPSLHNNTDKKDLSKPYSSTSYNLIRTLTSMSQVPGVSPFQNSEDIDARLDPNSDDFDSKFWIKNMRKLIDSDPGHFKPTSLGIAYRNLCCKGIASDADFQPTVANISYKFVRDFYYNWFKSNDESRYFEILKPMDALIKPGTLTVVLGRPGAGCSTLLKTLAAQTYGFKVDSDSKINYDGLTPKEIHKHYRGDVVYCAETEAHIAQLTVGQTLEFAALLRTPQNRPIGVSREEYARHMTKVYMATYGLSHTVNTKVGDEFIRGVSGGERKRVSLAEVSLCGSNVQCWDNATRGLDSATALEFVKALKTSAMVLDTTQLIAIYQCSQDTYDLFDNVILLYEGYQIYYGSAASAKSYFERMGWVCPDRQTTADFLTSITSPEERIVKPGWEHKVPKTPKEFSECWRNSKEYSELVKSIDYHIDYSEKNDTRKEYKCAHVAKQSDHIRSGSSLTVSFWMQLKILTIRNWWRLKGDSSISLMTIIGNSIMGLILSSLFYNLADDTSTFYYRTAALFYAVLFNGCSSFLEVINLFQGKQIVEKHKKYALYSPSAEAFSSILFDLPVKLLTALCFNLVYYFMINFRREPGRFFFFFLMNFMATLVMSHIFRAVGSCFDTLPGSMTPSNLFLMALVLYTGFSLPTGTMHAWSRWINYIDPIAYAFEALVANEFSGRQFNCTNFVPAYPDMPMDNKVCNVVSSKPGLSYINGTDYIAKSFGYYSSHRWRNFGIMIAYAVFFLLAYIVIIEGSKAAMQKGEKIVFQLSTLSKLKKQHADSKGGSRDDIEATAGVAKGEKPAGILDDRLALMNQRGTGSAKLIASDDVFHWRDVCYEVKIKDENRRILDHVDGWVKPGTLTALMGASGAGKTTLLDVLANRVTMGVVSGQMFVNGHLRDHSFQRSTGYVQQLDLHLESTTVREALRFSACLRQSSEISKKEKNAYVENVIDVLDMGPYADAIVGIAGEGLNVEQRKRLTIGVELAAKPQLLLFLDEPTSGLDSQTAWSICKLIRKLANNGQAIMCTIHQPSAMLIQEFDRLLFLAKGGRTVYFGELGNNCETLIKYFESKGAPPCPPNANPAEWMLEVIGAAPGSHTTVDYHQVWLASEERSAIRSELATMEEELALKKPISTTKNSKSPYAAPYWYQFYIVTKRCFESYWRNPSYIWSKIYLVVLTSLFNGFTFYKAGTSLQGLQNQMLSVFMYSSFLLAYGNQMLPYFTGARSLYEAREGPSKAFSWVVFIASQITVEIPWAIFCGTLGFFCWYYPIGLQNNPITHAAKVERGGLSWMLLVEYFIYINSLTLMCISGADLQENGANLASLCFTMSLAFNGVLYYPTGFWKFMYRLSPFTYWVAGILSAGIGDTKVHCAEKEFVRIQPPEGQTCGEYMQPYIGSVGGYLRDGAACDYCSISDTNIYLKSLHIAYDERWRNWGILFCYIAFDYFMVFFIYWLKRVPKKNDRVQDESQLKSKALTNVDEKPEDKRFILT